MIFQLLFDFLGCWFKHGLLLGRSYVPVPILLFQGSDKIVFFSHSLTHIPLSGARLLTVTLSSGKNKSCFSQTYAIEFSFAFSCKILKDGWYSPQGKCHLHICRTSLTGKISSYSEVAWCSNPVSKALLCFMDLLGCADLIKAPSNQMISMKLGTAQNKEPWICFAS